MLIFIPFVDQSVKMDKAARKLFDRYVERNEDSFFIDVLGHCFCEDGVLLFVDFLCPLDVSAKEIKDRFSNWKRYAPWLKKEIDEYIEKNAFSSSFIIANISQCFSSNLNRLKDRKRKLSGVFISTILDDCFEAYLAVLKEKLLEPIKNLLAKLGVKLEVDKSMSLKTIRKRFMRIGLAPCSDKDPMIQLRELIAFMLNYTRKKLNHNDISDIRDYLRDLNIAILELVHTKYIGRKTKVLRDYGQLKMYFIDSYPNIISLRPLIIL